MPSTRVNTALTFISGFETLSTDLLLGSRTESCTHIFAPASLSMEPRTNTAFRAHLSHLREIIARFPVIPKEIMEDEAQNRVIVWATGRSGFHEELMDDGLSGEEWAYTGEYVFVFSLDGTGRRIERIVEFVDSKGTGRFWGLIERARGNLARLEGDRT